MELFGMIQSVANVLGNVAGIITAVALLVKPIRERILGMGLLKNALLGLLASEIRKIYYKNLDDQTLRQHEYETVQFCYSAYKAMGGNSFIKHIVEEMEHWKVIS